MQYTPMIPNGLGYVYNSLKPLNLNISVLDLNIFYYYQKPQWWTVEGGFDLWSNQDWVLENWGVEIAKLAKAIVTDKPPMVGISVSGTSQCFANELIKQIRGLSDTIILIGGYSCEYHYTAAFNVPDYDYMIIREAEKTLPDLMEYLIKGIPIADMPGVLSRYDSPERTWRDGEIPTDVDAVDFPRYEWANLDIYPGAMPLMMSRGCGWGRCHFCSECFEYRIRNPIKVADEIEWLINHGKQQFVFGDSSLNSDHDVLMTLCNEMIERKLNCWFRGQYHVDKHSSVETFLRLGEAGCGSLAFGIDGWTDRVLKLQNKGYTMAMAEEVLKNCISAGIPTSVNMIIGVPGETEDDISESIENIIRLKNYISAFQNMNNLILSAGSNYYLNPEKYNIAFNGDKDKLYKESPVAIPEESWYSYDPFIDNGVREARRRRIANALVNAGVNLTDYARWQAKV